MTASATIDADTDPEIVIKGLHIDVLEGAFSWFIRSLDYAVSRDLDRRTARLEIARGKGQITALFLVDDHPGVRPSQIADVLMRDRPATGRIIDRLVRDGVIERRTDPADLRAQALFITEKGHALSQEIREIIRQQEAEFFDFIAPEDRPAFMRMLKRTYLNMRKKWD